MKKKAGGIEREKGAGRSSVGRGIYRITPGRRFERMPGEKRARRNGLVLRKIPAFPRDDRDNGARNVRVGFAGRLFELLTPRPPLAAADKGSPRKYARLAVRGLFPSRRATLPSPCRSFFDFISRGVRHVLCIRAIRAP